MPTSMPFGGRSLPALDADNRAFWTGGADGSLHIAYCQACFRFSHPPTGVCRHCLSDVLVDRAVGGHGVIESFTVNHQAWHPDMAVPFVIARVSLPDAPGVILTTNIIDCACDEVAIGDRVAVRFERHGDIHLPLFVLARDGG